MKDSFSLKNLKKHGLSIIALLLVAAFIIKMFYNYFTGKNRSGYEKMSQNNNSAYGNNQRQPNRAVQPSEPLGQNEVFASVNSAPSSGQGIPSSCNTPNIQNPSDLLPKDKNSEWAQLNPAGKGDLANINLLKAGYHIGIDTIGQTLRNANLQIRSEPPNPQINVGPWNLSTIEPDFMRPPLQIGSGSQ
jgi:hypothetical protein